VKEGNMAITTISGEVSHFQQSSQTSGFVGHQGGAINTIQVQNFRIGNRPVTFKFTEGGVSNGDVVTVAGTEKNGTFRGLSLRNETTGATLKAPTTLVYLVAICSLLLGIPLSIIIIGLPFLILGIVFAYFGIRNTRANAAIAASPLSLPKTQTA
jgi:hypothetical protein